MMAALFGGSPQLLPSSFMLRELKEIGLPESVSWWPQTLGWQILLVLVACYLSYRLYQKLSHWWRNRYRQEAIDALLNLSATDPHWPSQMMKIIKIVLVYLEPKNASLYGHPLLQQMACYHGQTAHLESESFLQWLKCLEDPKAPLPDFAVLSQGLTLWLSEHQMPEARRDAV